MGWPGEIWTIAAERAKNSKPRIVALSEPAILSDLAEGYHIGKRLVFTTTDNTAVCGFSNAKKRLGAAMEQLARKDARPAGRRRRLPRGAGARSR
jgi:hypothetical protein